MRFSHIKIARARHAEEKNQVAMINQDLLHHKHKHTQRNITNNKKKGTQQKYSTVQK